MNVLFAHDHRFIFDGGKYYTSGGLPDLVLSRYVEAFGELTVTARIISEAKGKEGNRIKNPHICFKNILEGKRKVVKEAVKCSDIVIARVPSVAATLAVYYAKRYKKILCVEVVGDARTYFYHGGWIGKIAAFVMVLLEKWCTWTAGNVIYVSRFFLQKRYPTRGRTLACPDVSFPVPDERVLEKRLDRIAALREREAVVGLIGSLDVDYRGHKSLLLAAEELKRRGILLKVRFLGGGSAERWIRLSERLHIAGEVEFCDPLPNGIPVLRWIDEIDILVMPTKQETLGRAIIEAMSRGCPVLGSIETAIWEQIGADCLFQADDYRRLADLIEEMLGDRAYMEICARENFWRSFKYNDTKSDRLRRQFFEDMKREKQSR